MSAIMAGDAIASEWRSFLEEILQPLEARSWHVVDNEEYEKEEALDEQLQLEYAMMALGAQGNKDTEETEEEIDPSKTLSDNNDQFHFDDAHDLNADDIEYETESKKSAYRHWGCARKQWAV